VRPRRQSRSVGLVEGWRSGFEEEIASELKRLGVPVQYEPFVIRYEQPSKARRYTPDFVLPNGIIIETKGRFVTQDRQKHLLIQAQHPSLDIRFVFSNANTRISKQSKTTYAAWCEAKGFLYTSKHIPTVWLREPANPAALRAIKELMTS
jgi:hypothetical protein